jgi:hypothetical protein
MSFLSRLLARLGRERIESADRPRPTERPSTTDRPSTTERPSTADRHSTTGTSESDTFVGRVSGEDAGYLDTGAEHREDHTDRPAGRRSEDQ